MRYDGWLWDPAEREWVEVDVDEIELVIRTPQYPRPTQDPRPAQSLDVPGWEWDSVRERWDIGTTPTEWVWVTPRWPAKPTEVPSRTQPAEVEGWRYNFTYLVWETTTIERVLVEVEVERPPKPEYPPGDEVLKEQPGWSWSEISGEWVATVVYAQKIGFTPPRSFQPNVELAQVNMVFPMTEQHALFTRHLLDMGLTETEARRIGSSMVDGFWNMSRSALTKARAAEYAQSFQSSAVAVNDQIETIAVYGAVIALAAIVGALIGTIAERLTFVDEDLITIPAEYNTYLLGPEDWAYSRNVGLSLEGSPLYSSCEGIGTEYTRHKRGSYIGDIDYIDFPGGFVEEGYVFPYFVKYTWQYWALEYVGMLFSVGADFYALKNEKHYSYGGFRRGETAPPEEWCGDFHPYL